MIRYRLVQVRQNLKKKIFELPNSDFRSCSFLSFHAWLQGYLSSAKVKTETEASKSVYSVARFHKFCGFSRNPEDCVVDLEKVLACSFIGTKASWSSLSLICLLYHHKVIYKAVANVHFFNFLVRLLCKTSKSSLAHTKWKCNLALRILQIISNIKKKTFWHTKRSRI